MITVPPHTVTCTVTPVETAPPGVYTYTVSCQHMTPYTAELLAAHIQRWEINGVTTYAINPMMEPVMRVPSPHEIISGYMARMGHCGAEFPCECWNQWVMRHGRLQSDLCQSPEFSRQ